MPVSWIRMSYKTSSVNRAMIISSVLLWIIREGHRLSNWFRRKGVTSSMLLLEIIKRTNWRSIRGCRKKSRKR